MISLKKSKVLTTDKYFIAFGIIVITIVFLPYIYWGEDTYVRIHDNLDSNIVWVKMILDQYGPFGSPTAIIQQPMDGLPRSSVYGSYDIGTLFFYLFGTFRGYVINKFLMAVIGFMGMYFLLKKHFSSPDVPLYITTGVSLCFGLLPFWSFTMSVSGLPLLLYAFLNIRNKDYQIINWAIIILLGFYSSLVLTGLFFLIIMLIIVIRDMIKYKRINAVFIGGMALLSASYLISHLPLILSHFNEVYISHRTEFQSVLEYPTKTMLKRISAIFRKGDGAYLGLNHAPSLHRWVLIPVILAIFLLIKYKIRNRSFIYILSFITVTSCIFGLLEWNNIASIRDKFYSVFPLDLKRFYWLLPLCWYILLAISLNVISEKITKWGKYIAMAFLIFQLGYVIKNQDYITNKGNIPSYREFFAQQQFEEIRSFINKDSRTYRIISIGIHPSISQYNGFYTLDGFSSDYPLAYKHQFGRIIDRELKKDEEIHEKFRGWGSWCYAFSAELGLEPYIKYKEDVTEIESLDYNYNLLKSMGGEYILSAVRINTENTKELEFLKAFEKNSYEKGATNWDIYLYKVSPQPPALENNAGAEPVNDNTQ